MATSASTSRGGAGDARYDRHPAELYDRIVGPVLILVGLLGFIASSAFDTGNNPPGDNLIIFEVNGWHNLVHIASGLLLCLGIGHWARARTVTLAFGVTYLLVTIIGFIDGNDVLGILPVNAADNVLHLVLSLTAIAAGLAPAPGRRHDLADSPGRARTGDVRSSATGPATAADEDRFSRGERVGRDRTSDRL
jgi:hypothetical protein